MIHEAKLGDFEQVEIFAVLTHGDLLESAVGQRITSAQLTLAWGVGRGS